MSFVRRRHSNAKLSNGSSKTSFDRLRGKKRRVNSMSDLTSSRSNQRQVRVRGCTSALCMGSLVKSAFLLLIFTGFEAEKLDEL